MKKSGPGRDTGETRECRVIEPTKGNETVAGGGGGRGRRRLVRQPPLRGPQLRRGADDRLKICKSLILEFTSSSEVWRNMSY
ncbi:Dynein Heavy Chain 12, Axonemal [Manis pentadactyla]|nr:Dynein Heavy Chain 12, Axonemal [Manis pentadactyla]